MSQENEELYFTVVAEESYLGQAPYPVYLCGYRTAYGEDKTKDETMFLQLPEPLRFSTVKQAQEALSKERKVFGYEVRGVHLVPHFPRVLPNIPKIMTYGS